MSAALLANMSTEKSIFLFNECWKQWVISLQKQVPELHDDFEDITNGIYTLSNNDPDSPMYYFQSYTANYLDLLLKRDIKFFDELSKISNQRGIPSKFTQFFEKMSTKQQDTIWVTLTSLTIWVSNVYPEYKQLLQNAKAMITQ